MTTTLRIHRCLRNNLAVLLIAFCLAILSACVYVPPVPLPEPLSGPKLPDIGALGGERIRVDNGDRLVETIALPALTHEPIAAVVFMPDAEELVAMHVNSGMLYRWNLSNSELVDEHVLGPVGVGAVSFDASTNLVVTGAGYNMQTRESPNLIADFEEWRLFDTQTGSLLVESEPPTLPFEDPISDIRLSLDGSWIAEVSKVGGPLAIYDAKTAEFVWGFTSIIHRPDLTITRFAVATFDTTGEWAFFADDDGNIKYSPWQTTKDAGNWKFPVMGTALDLAIDPTRRFLALAATEGFAVTDLSNKWWEDIDIVFTWPSPDTTSAAGLAFSPDGEVIAVSTKHSWQLWSVIEGQLLHENEDGGYAVAFSPDGTMLAVGGIDGVVRIYAVDGIGAGTLEDTPQSGRSAHSLIAHDSGRGLHIAPIPTCQMQ